MRTKTNTSNIWYRTRKDAESCPVFITTDIIGKRWTILVLQELFSGDESGTRFSQLQKALSWVSSKILTERLRTLEEQGLVKRRVDASVMPAKVFYSLTEKGLDFQEIIIKMQEWGTKWGTMDRSVKCLGPGIGKTCLVCRENLKKQDKK